MAKPQRVAYFKISLEDSPGTLLAIMKDLKSKNLGLAGLWGYTTSPGKADMIAIPKNADKLRRHWKSSGLQVEEGSGFFIKGTDKTGALVKYLDSLAHAGVNIMAVDAVAVGGKFGSFLWVSTGSVEKAAQALGAK